jgi:transcriptional regulator with XRE-family HTH domain
MAATMAPSRPVAHLVAVAAAREAVRGGRLRELRERHGLTQRELARALDVSHTCITRWESGDRIPRERSAERIAGLLHAFDKAGAAP